MEFGALWFYSNWLKLDSSLLDVLGLYSGLAKFEHFNQEQHDLFTDFSLVVGVCSLQDSVLNKHIVGGIYY